MSDATNEPNGTGTAGTQPEAEAASPDRAAQARMWLEQLQSMIEDLASHAVPVARDIGAKAAELAAVAGEKAGPIAARAAEVTAGAGTRLAERSRSLATELRSHPETAGEDPAAVAPTPEEAEPSDKPAGEAPAS